MKKVKFSLARLPDVQVIQQCNNIKTALTGNASFTTPSPSLASFGTALATAQVKLTAAENAQLAAQQAMVEKDNAILALVALAMQLAGYVEQTAAGDEAKILSAAMQVRAARVAATVPEMVQNLSLTAGDNAGRLDIQWDSISGGTRYEVQLCPTMDFAAGVINLTSVTKSKTVATGLTTGTRTWARVCAVNAAGPGAWSDVTTKIVP
jgi:hypothetical protein